MTSDDSPQGDSFDERARTLNSNLRRLIEAISDVLSASSSVLGRLQRLLGGSGSQAADTATDAPSDDDPPPSRDRTGD